MSSWFSDYTGMGATVQSTKIILLENVMGFMKVAEKVWIFLEKNLPGYLFSN